MPEADSELDNLKEVIRSRTFDELIIKRVESDCYLIVMTCGKAKVYADRLGKHKIYRHAWQIRDWLSSTFGIPPETVRVETIIP